jgi:hypothetical protein
MRNIQMGRTWLRYSCGSQRGSFAGPPEEIAAADAVVLLTDHEAVTVGNLSLHARYVLDRRPDLPRPNAEIL